MSTGMSSGAIIARESGRCRAKLFHSPVFSRTNANCRLYRFSGEIEFGLIGIEVPVD